MRWLARPDWIGWLTCALGAVLLAVIANLYIVLARPFGATKGIPIEQTGPGGALIGAIVPYVWLFLFAGMGTAFWLLVKGGQRMNGAAWAVVVLVLLCVGYPVYTGALNLPQVALAGNAAVLVATAVAIRQAWPISRLGAALLVPVFAWVSIASVALVALLTGQRF